MINERRSPALRVVLTDILLLNVVYLFLIFVVKKYTFSSPRGGEHYILLLILFVLLWIFISILIVRYSMELKRTFLADIKKIFISIALLVGLVSIYAFLFKGFQYSRMIIYGTIIIFLFGLILTHGVLFYSIKWLRKKRPLKRKVLIIGDDHTALRLSYGLLKDNDIIYETIVYIESESMESKVDMGLIVGKLKDVETVFISEKFDELYIVVSSSSDEEIRHIVEVADYYGVRIRMVPSFYKLFERNFDVRLVNDIPVINVNESPLDKYYSSLFKRTFDIVFSVVALILTSPLLLILSILIKTTSKGPVLYIAERVGLGGIPFHMIKFRTMYHSEKNGDLGSTRKRDPRVTPLGRLLRRTNLDELPQFFNVLKGDMSVVGPRPHRVSLDKKLQDEVDKYMIRHYIKPGITGWAQVNGWRGPTATGIQKKLRTHHDLWYIQNWSFALDVKIIFLTLFGKKAWQNAF